MFGETKHLVNNLILRLFIKIIHIKESLNASFCWTVSNIIIKCKMLRNAYIIYRLQTDVVRHGATIGKLVHKEIEDIRTKSRSVLWQPDGDCRRIRKSPRQRRYQVQDEGYGGWSRRMQYGMYHEIVISNLTDEILKREISR